MKPGDPGSSNGRGAVVVTTSEDLETARVWAQHLEVEHVQPTIAHAEQGQANRQGTEAVHQAVKSLGEQSEVRRDKVVAVGVGRGCDWAYLSACERDALAALVLVDPDLVYDDLDAARPVQPLEMMLNLDAPTLCVYRGASVPAEARGALQERADAFSRHLTVLEYPDLAPSDELLGLPEFREALLAFLDEHLS